MSGSTAVVEIGVCMAHHGNALPPHVVAREAEMRGIDALFLPENSHVPIARPGTIRQFDGIERLAGFYDPFTALAACAAVTNRIRLGTSVCLLTQRDPLGASRSIASLDRIANGRFILGVAGGFIREAMENYGSPFAERWKIVRERVHAMRAIWNQQVPAPVGDAGEFDAVSETRPGHLNAGPPIWIGSNSKHVPARVADYADGWMTRPELYDGDAIADLRQACEVSGRRFDDLTVALMGAPLDPDDAAECVERGYRQLIYFVREEDPAKALACLDKIADLGASVRRSGLYEPADP